MRFPLTFVPETDRDERTEPRTACAAQVATLGDAFRASRRIDDELIARARDVAQRTTDSACVDSAATLVREMAIFAHKDGQRGRRSAPIAHAISLYGIYLGLRPLDAMVRFYLAEALYTQRRYDEAAPQYLLTATFAPWGKYFNESIYAARIALRLCDASNR